jgi:glycerophosphoryl diester phosphodiesterase
MFAHRGFSGLYPENTLLSFEKAAEAGADILEMDAHATRDGHIVISHDSRLDRMTEGKGRIKEHTLSQIKRLDAAFNFSLDNGETFPFRGKGITIPTLREVAEKFPHIPFNIEIKQNEPKIEQAVFELLQELDHADLVLLAAESDVLMERIRFLDAGLPTNFASSEVLEFLQQTNLGQWADYHPAGRALQIPEKYYGMQVLTPELLEAAHRLEVEVHVWTVNDEADMRRLLKMGVDGIMTDYPQRLRRVIKNLNMRDLSEK